MYQKTYLAHHGILGQKWGIRRFQNADGTLTSAGKARKQEQNFKTIKKAYKKGSATSGNPYSAGENFRQLATSIAKNTISSDDVDSMVNAKKRWLKLENSTEDFYDSKEAIAASKKAYDDTYKYFEKNEPDFLNEILKK